MNFSVSSDGSFHMDPSYADEDARWYRKDDSIVVDVGDGVRRLELDHSASLALLNWLAEQLNHTVVPH